jgi:hypothetical protein
MLHLTDRFSTISLELLKPPSREAFVGCLKSGKLRQLLACAAGIRSASIQTGIQNGRHNEVVQLLGAIVPLFI